MTFVADAKYYRDHRRVNRIRGKARTYPCELLCGRDAYEWGHTHETDPAEPQNYRPLCRSCHRKYDGAGYGMTPEVLTARAAKVSAFRKGRKLSEEHKAAIGRGLRAAQERKRAESSAS